MVNGYLKTMGRLFDLPKKFLSQNQALEDHISGEVRNMNPKETSFLNNWFSRFKSVLGKRQKV